VRFRGRAENTAQLVMPFALSNLLNGSCTSKYIAP